MSLRETRCSLIPEEWKERLARRACPVCGKERPDFDGRHRGWFYEREQKWLGGFPACSKDCTSKYWDACKTWPEHRRQLFAERGGKCAHCGTDLYAYPDGHPLHQPYLTEDWVLDHIVPIAIGGSMWDPANHQILCAKCNKAKTAKDMGKIARYKKGHIPDPAGETTRQQPLF
jgi:5-methylcytosine-specific restriction endonuclease McrA